MGHLALLLLLTAAPAPEAAQLNTEGFRLYKQGELENALSKFRQAVAADDRYALAHYNLAATTAKLAADDPCKYLGSETEIFAELTRAIALDPGRRARALVDADFTALRSRLAWRRLVLNFTAKTSLQTQLEGTTFTSYAGWGSMGNSVNLRFLAGGKLLLGLKEETDAGLVVVDHPGRWSVEGNTLHIRMTRKADSAYSGDAVFAPADDSLEFPKLGKLVNYLAGQCDA